MRLRALSGFMARLFDPRRKARTVDAATGLSGDAPSVPLGGTRAQTTQRLQVGIAGLAGTLLLIGLIDLIETRADETERTAVPEAVATNQPSATPTRSDPLIDAGVVPDLPANPTPATPAGGEAPILPEQGGGENSPPQ